jgi:hypothetical protein
MERRDFLKVGAAAATFAISGFKTSLSWDQAGQGKFYGWFDNPEYSQRFIENHPRPYFVQRSEKSVKDSGKGRVVLLHKALERALGGDIVPHHQKIGDCVGQAMGFGVDTLTAAQIYILGQAEQFKAKAATEALYAGSRYEIGYQEHGSALIRRGDGSHVTWCAEFARDYGVLLRGKYGEYDLSEYSGRLARSWGKTGVPDDLEPKIKEHPVRTFALTRNYEEVRDAIANGYPVVVGSNVGFDYCRRHNRGGDGRPGRDDVGFLVPCGQWSHAMCFIGVDDKSGRPGVLCMNSWGPNWVAGGTRHGQPMGSFWIDAEVVNRMCSYDDAVAISNYLGYPAQPEIIDYNLFTAA